LKQPAALLAALALACVARAQTPDPGDDDPVAGGVEGGDRAGVR
jgi:hypothetical protein